MNVPSKPPLGYWRLIEWEYEGERHLVWIRATKETDMAEPKPEEKKPEPPKTVEKEKPLGQKVEETDKAPGGAATVVIKP